MPRLINLSNRDRRDAQVALESPPKPPSRRYVGRDGHDLDYVKLIAGTKAQSYPVLHAQLGSDAALSAALVTGDPEIDHELVGRKVGASDRVWVRPDGSALYAARVMLLTFAPDGEEFDRQEFVDVEATVNAEAPLPWTGRLLAPDDVIRRHALGRKLQLRHLDDITYDFLYEMARVLHDQQKLLFVGAGGRGSQPLVFQRNGTPYRGFLEGRVSGAGGGFSLVLHLSNLELKRMDA